MSRRNIIIAVIVVVLLGAAAGYYFLYYTEEPQPLTEDTTQVTQEQEATEETPSESQTEEMDAQTEGDEGDEPESIEEEVQDEEIELTDQFAFRNEIRNPFGNVQQQQTEPVVTKEALTIPFRLDGIITNGNQQIAIISTQEGPRFTTGNENIGEYYISNVTDDQIRIRYKYLTVYMKIGGALVE